MNKKINKIEFWHRAMMAFIFLSLAAPGIMFLSGMAIAMTIDIENLRNDLKLILNYAFYALCTFIILGVYCFYKNCRYKYLAKKILD